MPFGVLNVLTGLVTIVMGTNLETSEFWADALGVWWQSVKAGYAKPKRLVVRLDNGPACRSDRRRWMKRLVEFVDATGLIVELVYYPPYHSKYNPIERVWGRLEQHWNGTLLDSVQKVVGWAGTMTWLGRLPSVYELTKDYPKTDKIKDADYESIQARLKRSKTLPKWHVIIEPVADGCG